MPRMRPMGLSPGTLESGGARGPAAWATAETGSGAEERRSCGDSEAEEGERALVGPAEEQKGRARVGACDAAAAHGDPLAAPAAASGAEASAPSDGGSR